ncbi:MAG: UDP-N-acetylglucosamine 2-epimerase (hydrolyzing) [Alphaproteobacteria bacterium]|nr:UDP-N-acetylglucosamine 2-epimerase (hydrolyzing) [Alphaproteobacteria bacterium]
MNAPRKICVVTGSRADYGLLAPLMREIGNDESFRLQILATGSHFDPRLGTTAKEIESDGFSIDARVDLSLSEDTPRAIAEATGKAAMEMARELDRLKPDLTVVLGDRYESLAAAQAAFLSGVSVAHIHGGEVTEGAMDDAIRHAITKLSHLHFAAAEPYARRIIQMGESPDRVFSVGALGVEAALALNPIPPGELDRDLGLALRNPTLLITYHPVTLRQDDEGATVDALCKALDLFDRARIVITGVNADPGREIVATRLATYTASRADRATLHASLGQRRYLSVMRRATAVIGNSSSGIIEAPALGIPTVNIGSRQQGRLKARSVIDCGENAGDIHAAIARAIDPAFRIGLAGQSLPYGGGGTAAKIAAVLKGAAFDQLRLKPFYDLPGAAA